MLYSLVIYLIVLIICIKLIIFFCYRIITQNWYLFFKALTKSMVIPKFEELRHAVGVLYGEIEGDVTGEVSKMNNPLFFF